MNVNGQWIETKQANISILNRGFLFGDGVYETIRTYAKKPFALEKHFERLKYSAEKLKIELPDLSLLTSIIYEGIERMTALIEDEEIYIRLIVTRGTSEFSLRIVSASPDFILIFRPLKSSGKEGVKIKISRIRKIPPESIDPRIKAIGQVDKILARLELSEDEYEAIMLSYNGYLAEGTMSNIFIVSNDRLITPSLETGILSGITRDVVIEIARKKSIEVEERFVELSELFNADEVFLTHTSAEIVPVRYVEKIEKKVGSITSILKAEFREYINEWLSNKNPG